MMNGVEVFFCNACGQELRIPWRKLMGREFKVCSPECIREIELRRARSILDKSAPTLLPGEEQSK